MIGAVDLGGTKIAVGMVDESGQVLAKMEFSTDAYLAYANGRDRIVAMLRETAQAAGTEIAGISIGSTGPVNSV